MFGTDLKIKPMNKDELVLAIDRLTRFKLPAIKYNRVFKEIISRHLIDPKIGYKIYETLEPEAVSEIIEKIFEFSVFNISKNKKLDYSLNDKVFKLENALYDIDTNTLQLLKTKIPYSTILSLVDNKDLCLNLKFINALIDSTLSSEVLRFENSLKFPIEKVLLVEGITEEILLPVFAKIMDYDFDKYGVEVVAAGGKNSVAKDYLEFSSQLKVPIVVLLDSDAKLIAKNISAKLRETDKLILIEKGEFEDILPVKLLKKAINYKFKNLLKVNVSDLKSTCMVKKLEELYRYNALGDFKKAEFANDIKNVLTQKNKNFVSVEVMHILEELKTC